MLPKSIVPIGEIETTGKVPFPVRFTVTLDTAGVAVPPTVKDAVRPEAFTVGVKVVWIRQLPPATKFWPVQPSCEMAKSPGLVPPKALTVTALIAVVPGLRIWMVRAALVVLVR